MFGRGQVETTREVMPSMLTLDRRVIQQDCLCYLMDRIHYEFDEEVTGPDLLPEGIRRSDRPGDPLAVTGAPMTSVTSGNRAR